MPSQESKYRWDGRKEPYRQERDRRMNKVDELVKRYQEDIKIIDDIVDEKRRAPTAFEIQLGEQNDKRAALKEFPYRRRSVSKMGFDNDGNHKKSSYQELVEAYDSMSKGLHRAKVSSGLVSLDRRANRDTKNGYAR